MECPAVSEPKVHPTAVVEDGARLGPGVEVGPYAVVGAGVVVGAGTSIGPHAVLRGPAVLGEKNRIFPFASLGTDPQDLKFRGEESRLEIGNGNTFREFVTVNRGTAGGGGVTRIGDENLLMAYTHVAHDCRLGDRVVMANGAQLGGHVEIGHFAVLGALCGIHQFVRIGESAMVGAGSMVSQDVPPFLNATGDRATLHGLNLVGLRRRGIPQDNISALKRAYRILFLRKLPLREAMAEVQRSLGEVPEVRRLVDFLEASRRGVCRP